MMEELSTMMNSCRLCYAALEGGEDVSQISKSLERQFYYLFNFELKASTMLSCKVCQECNHRLGMFHEFKQEIVANQDKLYKLLENCQLTENFEELQQDLQIEPSDEQLKNYVTTEDFKTEASKSEIEFTQYEVTENLEQYEVRQSSQKKRRRKDPFRHAIVDDFETSEKIVEAKRFACPECQKHFSDKNKVRMHVQRVHQQIKNHNCDECNYKAHSKWDILRHMKAHHMPKETDPKDLRICPDCGKVLKGNNHLNFHIKTKHLKLTKYSCDLCDFKSYGKYEIRSHLEIHHLPLELRKGFPCDLCPSVLTTAMSLKTHKTHKHSGLRPHQCFCGKSYALRETLKSHIRNVHNGERKYKCPHCEKGFNSNPRLRDHVNNNHGTKQEIPCEKCGKVFNSIRNLQTHMIYHQAPTLKCNYCDKLFYIKKNLREHQESVHLGIIHSCELCNRAFQSTSGLRRHSKSHCKI